MENTILFKYQGSTYQISRSEMTDSGWFVRLSISDPRILLIGEKPDQWGYHPIIRTYEFSRVPIANLMAVSKNFTR